ncbi:hypothetical protein NQ487_27610 [Hungatella hathewayi]|jgi:hypothetical protein|uniref:Uncharacterized protein n=2 Tax=Lachnospiraceae TaxID=186803 RepID=D3AIX2_9FIRM|nr:hypothetical protein [Hungatella hathewayi]EFC98233.1 hypothetical protein CLOSTHATH_03562 [Hungatella hathewayi DSM 13479]UWO84570.1 hypothetical protein NQ487_27610 [Hungatella hathewayi]
MIKLVGEGHVLIKEFQTEEEGLDYMRKNKDDLMWYYSYYELVVPGEKTIWAVSDTLISDAEFRKQVDAKIAEKRDNNTLPEEG